MSVSKNGIFVTGAAGFIGSHLVERLAGLGARVVACVKPNSRNEVGFLKEIARGDGVEVRIADVRDLQALTTVMQDCEMVLHLAAHISIPYSYQHPYDTAETNAIGTLNVLLAARQNQFRRVVLTSTSEVYGTAVTVPIDEGHLHQAQSPYSASKIAADAFGISFHRSFGLPVVIIRPFNTYGPRQSDRAIVPTLIAQALTKDEVEVGNISATRDFTYVTDTVEGFVRALEVEEAVGREINLGTGLEISIAELSEKIIRLVGRKNRLKIAEFRKRPASSEVQRLLSNNQQARKLLNWEPTVSLDDGLRRTIDWIEKHVELFHPDSYVI